MAKGENNAKCRVCLNCDTNVKYLSLFEEYNGYALSDKLNIITNIGIKKRDGLPDRICPDCLLELEAAIKFKQKCENSNIILRSTLTVEINIEPVVIKEEINSKFEYPEFDHLDQLDTLAIYENVKEEEETKVQEKKSRAIDLKLICDDCGGSFKSKCKLRVHWKKTHLYTNLICHKCKRQFKSCKAFQLHKKKNLRSCRIASMVNIEGVGKLRVFHCRECEYKTKRIKDIGAHIVSHTGDRPYVCNLCGKGFTQQGSLQSHQEHIHSQYIVDTTCQFCGKNIKGRTRLYRHMEQHKMLQVQCEVCKKMFKSKQYLRQHVKRHGNIKAYSCEICAKTFYTVADLSNHRRTIHYKVKKYKCEICNYLAYKAETIKRHTAKHTATNIPCLICGIFSENAEEFQIHKKRHVENTLECPHCESRFYKKKNLYRHIRNKHRCKMLVNRHVNPVNVKVEIPENENYESALIISPIVIN